MENNESLRKYDKTLVKNIMRGFSRTIILWLIYKKRQHGYEIMTKLNEYSGKKHAPGPGMIYPILHELEDKKLIKGIWESHGKRKVKYYEITEEGKKTLFRIKKLFGNLMNEFWGDISPKGKKKEL